MPEALVHLVCSRFVILIACLRRDTEADEVAQALWALWQWRQCCRTTTASAVPRRRATSSTISKLLPKRVAQSHQRSKENERGPGQAGQGTRWRLCCHHDTRARLAGPTPLFASLESLHSLYICHSSFSMPFSSLSVRAVWRATMMITATQMASLAFALQATFSAPPQTPM